MVRARETGVRAPSADAAPGGSRRWQGDGVPFLRPVPDELGPSGQPLAAPHDPGYQGDSADDLSAGVLLGAASALLLVAAMAGVWRPALLLALGLVVGAVGAVRLTRGVHRLAANADRALRRRLAVGPAPEEPVRVGDVPVGEAPSADRPQG